MFLYKKKNYKVSTLHVQIHTWCVYVVHMCIWVMMFTCHSMLISSKHSLKYSDFLSLSLRQQHLAVFLQSHQASKPVNFHRASLLFTHFSKDTLRFQFCRYLWHDSFYSCVSSGNSKKKGPYIESIFIHWTVCPGLDSSWQKTRLPQFKDCVLFTKAMCSGNISCT